MLLQTLDDAVLREIDRTDPDTTIEQIWAGDFNRHHPLWDDPTNQHLFTTHNLTEAQKLIDLTEKHNLEQVLPPGIPTLQALVTGNWT